MKVKELLQILNNFVDQDESALDYEINMNNEFGYDDEGGETPIVDVVIFPGDKNVTLYEY